MERSTRDLTLGDDSLDQLAHNRPPHRDAVRFGAQESRQEPRVSAILGAPPCGRLMRSRQTLTR
jgi:hypothetical protein